MKKLKNYIILLLIGVSVNFAQNKVGTTVGDFLTIPVGPRATGMGGAFVAVADDATSAFWNSSGLSRLPGNQFTAARADWLVGTSLNYVGVVIKLDSDNAFALSFNSLDYGDEEITTALQPNGTGQRWDAMDLAVGLSYSRNLTDRFSIGGTLKYIQSRIWNESASAFALDVGLLFTTQFNGLKIGMNIANFGTEMKLAGKDLFQPVDIDPANTGNNSTIVSSLETDSWNLPLMFTVGVGMDAVNTENWRWTVAADAIYPNNTTPYINGGTELVWNNILFLRVGYNSLFEEASEEGLTAGAGLQYNIGGFDLRIDYSYMDFGIFDSINRYSVSIGF
ncbi:MAG: PorV/PorQ family protein [Melioribacteraceae bacterium]|nr:hypothetical protein [Ignavibacteriota bacterium]MBZ0182197.1 PorV/PorQ family protein [Melioribacteraceae bacterium]